MRIPTSLIVMSIATAVPFGLAIRDTVSGKGHRQTAEEKQVAEERAAEEAYKAEQAAQEELEAKQAQSVVAKIDTMFGSTRASVGTAANGLELSAPITQDEAAKLEHIGDDISVFPEWDDDAETLTAVTVTVSEVGNSCDQLRAKLVAAWGPPTDSVWLAADGSQRAALDRCSLTFEPTLTPAAWFAKVDLFGKPQTVLGAQPTDDMKLEIDWKLPGLGYNRGQTQVVGMTAKNKVNFIEASAQTDFDSLVALRDVITARLKREPTVEDEDGAWVWRDKSPVVRLQREADSNIFTLTIGTRPEW